MQLHIRDAIRNFGNTFLRIKNVDTCFTDTSSVDYIMESQILICLDRLIQASQSNQTKLIQIRHQLSELSNL